MTKPSTLYAMGNGSIKNVRWATSICFSNNTFLVVTDIRVHSIFFIGNTFAVVNLFSRLDQSGAISSKVILLLLLPSEADIFSKIIHKFIHLLYLSASDNNLPFIIFAFLCSIFMYRYFRSTAVFQKNKKNFYSILLCSTQLLLLCL